MKSIVENLRCNLHDFEVEVQKVIDKYGDKLISVSVLYYNEYNDGKFVPNWFVNCKLLIIVKST